MKTRFVARIRSTLGSDQAMPLKTRPFRAKTPPGRALADPFRGPNSRSTSQSPSDFRGENRPGKPTIHTRLHNRFSSDQCAEVVRPVVPSSGRKLSRATIASLLSVLVAGCALWPGADDDSAGVVMHRFAHPPARAGECFARNAERHSSALVAEVSRPDAGGRVQVVVRVRNGVLYATLELRPLNGRAEGTLSLNVTSVKGNDQLVATLVEGC